MNPPENQRSTHLTHWPDLQDEMLSNSQKSLGTSMVKVALQALTNRNQTKLHKFISKHNLSSVFIFILLQAFLSLFCYKHFYDFRPVFMVT